MPFRFAVASFVGVAHSIEEFAAIIRAAGYEGVEWRLNDPGHLRPSSLAEDIRRARKVQKDQGIHPLALTSYIKILNVERVKPEIDAAAELGARHIRIEWPTFYDGSRHAAEVFDETRRAMDQLTPYLEKAKVIGILETHRRCIWPTASAAKRLIETYSPSVWQVMYDPGNITGGLEDPCYAFDILGEHLAYLQFKNAGWARHEGVYRWGWMPMRDGMVDWPTLIPYLRKRGYNGWLSNENFLLQPPELRAATKEALPELALGDALAHRDLKGGLIRDREYVETL